MNLINWKFRKDISRHLAWFVVIVALFCVLFPIYWMVRTAFMPMYDSWIYPPYLYPKNFTLEYFQTNPEKATAGLDMALEGMKHSAIIALPNSLICVAISLLAAFSIVRYRPGGFMLPIWILSHRFFPPIVFLLPFFIIFRAIGLYQTHMGLILPYLIGGIPFATWILMGFVEEIPKELDEAATIDGASSLQVIFLVIFPVIAPGVVVTLLFLFIGAWNEYLLALILSGPDWDTLAVVIPKYTVGNTLNYPQIAAVSLVGIMPGIMFATIIHRYLARGLTFGAIK